jgi:alpha-beta hydrolase superfamily lysophospholipase
MNTLRRSLVRTGTLALGLLVGLALTLMVLHGVGLVNIWVLPLKHLGAFFLGGSVLCYLGAGGVGLWQRRGRSSAVLALAHQRSYRWLWGSLVALVIGVNVPAYLMAYHVTHVRSPGQIGLGVPKPVSTNVPGDRGLDYATHQIPLQGEAFLEAWWVPTPATAPRGTVLLFPGNLGTKGSQLISPAQTFTEMGYDCLLVDFQGVGGSSGNTITIGMKEAQDVVRSLQYAAELDLPKPMILYGVSMGSVAIMRAIAQEGIAPDAVILELPFAYFLNAVRSRLRYHGLPAFPTAELLVFWGSLHHRVNGFHHNPIHFAQALNCPTLLIHGEQDKWTTVAEINQLFETVPGPKQLVISPDAGHHQLIGVDRALWDAQVIELLNSV